jgi:hypothetical protein
MDNILERLWNFLAKLIKVRLGAESSLALRSRGNLFYTANMVLFKLHKGTTVHHERSEDGWSLINLPDEKRGWIRSGALERIMGNGQ